MTKLEEEIYRQLLKKEGIDTCEDGNPITASICKGHAEIAAEVAKRYIKMAFFEGGNGMQWTGKEWRQEKTLQQFLDEFGITEQAGLVVSNGITSTE